MGQKLITLCVVGGRSDVEVGQKLISLCVVGGEMGRGGGNTLL